MLRATDDPLGEAVFYRDAGLRDPQSSKCPTPMHIQTTVSILKQNKTKQNRACDVGSGEVVEG